LACATLLALVAGCSANPADETPLIAVKDERGLFHYRLATPPTEPEVRTTLTVWQLRQQYEYDQEVKRLRQEAAADEAIRQRMRRDREFEELRRRSLEQDAQDRARKERREATRRQEQERRQRFNNAPSPGSQTDAWQLQQGATSVDESLRRLQQQQDQQLHDKMLRHNP
jgi:hypothetical protein